MAKEVYQLDHSHFFIYVIGADPDPLEPDHWLIPRGCVETPPPSFDPLTHKAKWTGMEWTLEDIPPEPEQPTPNPNAVPQPSSILRII